MVLRKDDPSRDGEPFFLGKFLRYLFFANCGRDKFTPYMHAFLERITYSVGSLPVETRTRTYSAHSLRNWGDFFFAHKRNVMCFAKGSFPIIRNSMKASVRPKAALPAANQAHPHILQVEETRTEIKGA